MSRVPLHQISSRAWEHPADRAALNALRALPGFDDIVRRIAGAIGESGLRYLFLANAVRVGPRQRPRLNALLTEVTETLDWPERPQLYVTQAPLPNAMAIGFEKPFIVVNSELLRVLGTDERRFILAHELGHIISGHTTYRTIAILLMTFGLGGLPFLAGVALLPFQLALLEWYRKSELSSDRAGLLGTQDVDAAMRTFLRMAGGEALDDEESLPEFMQQATDYELPSGTWDTVLKLINTARADHPFNTVRAAELLRWRESGAYEQMLAGQYLKRDEEQNAPGGYAEAASYYGEQTRDTFSQVGDVLNRARNAFNEKYRGYR